MARLGVTKEDVFAACAVLKERGVTVTVANVRAELGTGSYTTLLPLIQEFHEQGKKAAAPTVSGRMPETPKVLAEMAAGLVGSIWTQAWETAQAEIHALKAEWEKADAARAQALAEQSEALNQALTDLKRGEAEAERLNAELSSAQEAGHKKDAELSVLRQTLATRETEFKATLERAIGAETALAAKGEELSRVQAEKQRLQQEAESLKRELTASREGELKKDGEISLLRRQMGEKEQELKTTLERAVGAESQVTRIKEIQAATLKREN